MPGLRPTLRSWHLFALAVLIWGTTWIVIVHQLAEASAELGVATRFTLAGTLALAWAGLRGHRLRFAAREHATLALQGVFMYSVSYLCVYHAEHHVPSGLVAVGYSASPLVMGAAGWLLWRTPLSTRFLLGAGMCFTGVTLIFWPVLTRLQAGANTYLGAVFTVGAVLLSAVGSLTSSRNKSAGLPLWPALGYGMLYGAAVSWLFVLVSGQTVRWPGSLSWWAALAYLAVFGSIIAFACYLELQHRIGAGPTATVGASTTVIALVISTLFENYRPGWLGTAGVVLALTGNALALGWGAQARVKAKPGE